MKYLQKFCDELGNDVEFLQGGGANISVKTDVMTIKASGFTLKDMINQGGTVRLRFEELAKKYLAGEVSSEEQGRDVVRSCVLEGEKHRPSIETAFHSYLRKYVIHLHPIYLNALLCNKRSKELIQELYGDIDYSYVTYKKPGHFLAAEIVKDVDHPVFFMENHGVIVTDDDPEKCLQVIKDIMQRAKEYVGAVPRYPEPEKKGEGYLGVKFIDEGSYLFPDAVVYLKDIADGAFTRIDGRVFYDRSYASVRKIDEVLFAHNVLLELTKKLGGWRGLSDQDIHDLVEMEEEKFRKNMVVK